MKYLVGSDFGSYTFNAAAKTITLSGINTNTYRVSINLTLNQILLITNVTTNVIIYNFTNNALGATSIVNNVITLTYNTTGMNNSDVLQIFIDFPSDIDSIPTLLRRMNKLLESQAIVDSQGRQRVIADSIAGTTAITAATSLGPNIISNVPGGNPYIIPTDPATWTKDAFGAYDPTTGTAIQTPTVPTTEKGIDQRWRICDDTHRTYCDGIRTQLNF